MIWLTAIGLIVAGIGWAIDNGRVETLGTVMAVAGIAMLMVEHWPAR
jgi:hypothetical protein